MADVKLHKIISESHNGTRKEVIINDNGYRLTKHIQIKNGTWQYSKGKNQQGIAIFGSIKLNKE